MMDELSIFATIIINNAAIEEVIALVDEGNPLQIEEARNIIRQMSNIPSEHLRLNSTDERVYQDILRMAREEGKEIR